MGVKITKMSTPRAPKCPRGDEIARWAWVELNYRPHAYQTESERQPAMTSVDFLAFRAAGAY